MTGPKTPPAAPGERIRKSMDMDAAKLEEARRILSCFAWGRACGWPPVWWR